MTETRWNKLLFVIAAEIMAILATITFIVSLSGCYSTQPKDTQQLRAERYLETLKLITNGDYTRPRQW